MNESKHKETLTLLKKNPQLSSFGEKKMPFKLFEFLERYMIGTLLIT